MSRRVAVISDANMHVGPDLARKLAASGHDLVLGDPSAGLTEEIVAAGAAVEAVTGVGDLSDPAAIAALLDAARSRFGTVDAACLRTGKIISGPLSKATLDDLRALCRHNIESVFQVLQAVIPVMLDQGSGQIVIVTSATGAKPAPQAALYSATRAAANMMVKNAALEVADKGVTINAIGTNFLDYPGFVAANNASDPDVRARIERRVPVGRLGTPAEVAHFCASLMDGHNRFQTGQFFSLSGGWSD